MRLNASRFWNRTDYLTFRPWQGPWRDGLPTLFDDDLEARVRDIVAGWEGHDRAQEVAEVMARFRQRDRELAEVYVAAMASQDRNTACEAAHLMHLQGMPLGQYLNRQERDQRYPRRHKPVSLVTIVVVISCIVAWMAMVLVASTR